LLRNYFEETDALIWVVDSADRGRFGMCKAELAQVLAQEKLSGATVLILANKQDLLGAVNVEGIAKELGLDEMGGNRHWLILPCSAVTGKGLLEGMDWVVEDCGSRVYMRG